MSDKKAKRQKIKAAKSKGWKRETIKRIQDTMEGLSPILVDQSTDM
jgi:flavorubredoxin